MQKRRNAYRIKTFVGLITVLILLIGCDLSQGDEPFTVKTLDEVKSYGEGTFYKSERDFSSDAWTMKEVKALLLSLKKKDVPFETAFFKPQSSDCGTRDGIALQVIVPSQLLIRLAEPSDVEDLRGFETVNNPRLSCPYLVKQISLN